MTPSNSPTSRDTAVREGGGPHRRATWHGLDQSAVMTVELVVAILLYGGLGLLADRWLGSGPWLASLGTLVGLGAGLYLVWLRAARADGQARESAWGARR